MRSGGVNFKPFGQDWLQAFIIRDDAQVLNIALLIWSRLL
jgi:hypothetical protein